MSFLEDEIIILRPIEPGYHLFYFRCVTNTEVIGKYEPFTTGDFATFEANLQQSATGPKKAKHFVIVRKEGNLPVGIIDAYRAHTMVEDVEVGYAVIPDYRGNHFATRAVRLIVDYLFRSSPVERIQATPDSANVASTKILQKCGFIDEGKLRHYYFVNGHWRDTRSFSITREDWQRSQQSHSRI